MENGLQKIVANFFSGIVLLTLWDRFAESDIEIPFPRRDLHLRSVVPGIQWPEPMAAN